MLTSGVMSTLVTTQVATNVPVASAFFTHAANACSASANNGAKRQRQEFCFSTRRLKYVDEAAISVLHQLVVDDGGSSSGKKNICSFSKSATSAKAHMFF